jgi:hypothetical protein
MFGNFFLRMISLCDWGFAKAARGGYSRAISEGYKRLQTVVLPPHPPLAKIGDLGTCVSIFFGELHWNSIISNLSWRCV